MSPKAWERRDFLKTLLAGMPLARLGLEHLSAR